MNNAPFEHKKPRWLSRLALAASIAAGCAKQAPAPAAPEPAPPATEEAPAEVAKAPERQYPEPPAPSATKPVNFPDIQNFKLDNGLKVYVVENHETPLVAAQLVVRVGTMDDEQVAKFTASMLGEGTKTRTKAVLDESIEFVGGSLDSDASMHTSSLDLRVLKKDLKLGLTLMADQVMNPTFPADSLQKLKDQAKTELDASKADTGELASRLFGMVAYPEGHPYGRPFPSNQAIDAVTVDDLKKFHGTFYKANNAYLILAGDITPGEATPLVKAALGKWANADSKTLPPNPLNKFTKYELPEHLVVHLVDRPASAQSEILVGNLALARSHPDWIKLKVVDSILGGGASGRLFMDVREERGLTYGIYTHLAAAQAPGAFLITTSTKTKTTGEMMKAIFEHIERIRTTKPEDKEMRDNLSKLVGSFPLQLETAAQIAGKVNEVLVYNLPEDYWKTYRDKTAAVTAADVEDTAQKYVHGIPHIVVVGKASKIEKDIKAALPDAKIIKYDTDLKRLAGASK